jgi:hypothetical protein
VYHTDEKLKNQSANRSSADADAPSYSSTPRIGFAFSEMSDLGCHIEDEMATRLSSHKRIYKTHMVQMLV